MKYHKCRVILEILLIFYRKNPILIYFYLLNCKSVCFVHSVLKDCFLNKYKNYLPRRTLLIIFTLIIDNACNAVTLVHKQLRNRINLVAIEFISLVRTVLKDVTQQNEINVMLFFTSSDGYLVHIYGCSWFIFVCVVSDVIF